MASVASREKREASAKAKLQASGAALLAWSFAFADASRFSLLATLAMGVSGGALGVEAVSAIAWLT
ncbi:MAG TPA: hypothetical protein VM686_24360, partial [Polyangiaceae bacterium]|nr:hypothetical protein [Polyangiaceae bacterium]